jgi:hypothetical protein
MDQELDRPVTAAAFVVRLRPRIDAMMAQGQELLRTFRRLFESTTPSKMSLMLVAEGVRRRTEAAMPYAELVVGTVVQLLVNFRRRKTLTVATGVIGLALFVILLLEISLRIQLAQEARDAETDATLAASVSPTKKEFDDASVVVRAGN